MLGDRSAPLVAPSGSVDRPEADAAEQTVFWLAVISNLSRISIPSALGKSVTGTQFGIEAANTV